MKTNIMIAGSEHLEPDQIKALKNAFEELGASAFEFPTDGGGSRFNWGDYVSALEHCSHMILVLGRGDKSTLVTSAQARLRSPKVGLLCFDSIILDRHMWLSKEHRIDLVIVDSPHLHSRVQGSAHSLWIRDVERDAHTIASSFLGIKRRGAA